MEKGVIVRAGSWFSFAAASDPVVDTLEGSLKEDDIANLLTGASFAQGREKVECYDDFYAGA